MDPLCQRQMMFIAKDLVFFLPTKKQLIWDSFEFRIKQTWYLRQMMFLCGALQMYTLEKNIEAKVF